jgi:hypothetical protein
MRGPLEMMSRSQTTGPGCWSTASGHEGWPRTRPGSTSGASRWPRRRSCASGPAHDPERFEEFGRRYLEELKDAERAQALEQLRELAKSGTLTLLTATKHAEISEAAVLADLIRG